MCSVMHTEGQIEKEWIGRNFPSLLAEFIQEGSLVFDIGANIGRMTYAYLKLGARVVAVEPQTVCVEEELRPRFGSNERVIIVHAACGSQAGEAVMTTYGHGSTISTFVPDYYWQAGGPWANTPHDGKESVQMMTLDALIETFGVPDFIKIDVEGYELEVLQGLSRLVPLSFEFHPFFAPRAKLCLTHVVEIDPAAEFNHTVGEALTYASPEWLDREQMFDVVDALMLQFGKNYFGNIYARKRKDG